MHDPEDTLIEIHPGMPRLNPATLYPWFRRWLPDWLFYVLPAFMWLALSIRHGSLTLPTAANPDMDVGGLWGERKSQGLSLFGKVARGYLAPVLIFTRSGDVDAATDMQALAERMAQVGVTYPLVVKPDRGYQGWGVRQVRRAEDLQSYLRGVSPGADLMLQNLITYSGEAGIFYVRDPAAPKGRILSMALIYAPFVLGDGRNTVRSLVLANRVLKKSDAVFKDRLAAQYDVVPPKGAVFHLTNTRCARLGAVYLDVRPQITPALHDVIDQIAADIPNFYFGRFDIRFDSLEELQKGKAFQIVELNGAGAEVLHIWAGGKGLWQAFRDLWKQYKLLFSIGAAMRRAGHRPETFVGMIRYWRRQEKLRQKYPHSG